MISSSHHLIIFPVMSLLLPSLLQHLWALAQDPPASPDQLPTFQCPHRPQWWLLHGALPASLQKRRLLPVQQGSRIWVCLPVGPRSVHNMSPGTSFLCFSVTLNCLTLCLRYRPEVRPGVPDTVPPAGPADLAVAPGSWAHWSAHRCSHCHTHCCREEEVEA